MNVWEEEGGFRSMWAEVGAPGMSAPYPFHFFAFCQARNSHTHVVKAGGEGGMIEIVIAARHFYDPLHMRSFEWEETFLFVCQGCRSGFPTL